VQWFRGGLVFKAHRRLYHSTLGSRVIKKKKRRSLGHALVVEGVQLNYFIETCSGSEAGSYLMLIDRVWGVGHALVVEGVLADQRRDLVRDLVLSFWCLMFNV